MLVDGYNFMTSCITKFQKFLYISGWFHHPSDVLVGIRVRGLDNTHHTFEVGLPHGGVEAALGPEKGFEINVLRTSADALPDEAEIEFACRSGKQIVVRIADLSKDRRGVYATAAMSREFIDAVNAVPGTTLLDIGGRARSRIDRSKDFHNAEVTVLDILPDDNVDVVGDAHELSSLFAPESFDAVYSISVFEHLLMPWKVVVEMNRVMKTGGTGLVMTHQTLGMHDLPWDFWRFSDTAWDALFNEATGFEIIRRGLEGEQFIIPFIYRPAMAAAEKSAGYEASAVHFRKTGPCRVDWPVRLPDISATMYPTDDG